MDVNRLRSDELCYELIIRGVPPGSTVAEKRSLLREALREHRPVMEGSSKIYFEPEKELHTLSQKLDELLGEIHDFDHKNKENELKRIQSRLIHIDDRLDRVVPENSIGEKKKKNLKFLCSGLFDALRDAYHIANSEESPIQLLAGTEHSILDEPNLLLPSTMTSSFRPLIDHSRLRNSVVEGTQRDPPVEQLIDVEMNCSTNHQLRSETVTLDRLAEKLEDLSIKSRSVQNADEFPRRVSFAGQTSSWPPPQSTSSDKYANHFDTFAGVKNSGLQSAWDDAFTRFHSNQYVPLYKWNIYFDGNNSVTSFLERVEELRESRRIPKSQIFQSAVELFKGDALLWYRTWKSSFRDWDDLSTQLRRYFLPLDYESTLLSDIQKRTQGAEERLILYVSVMENLFNKLANKPCERDRVCLIRRNLLPELQKGLAVTPINTIEELLNFGRAVEESYVHASQYCPPPTGSRNLVEPCLAYHRRNRQVAAMCEQGAETLAIQSNVLPPTSERGPSRDFSCWNCGKAGHRRSRCPQLKLVCFRCGKAGYTCRNCPQCSGNAREDHKKADA